MVTTLGARMRQKRREKDISTVEAAEACGVSRQAYFYWEKDKKLPESKEKLLGFTKLADCSLDWLWEGQGASPPAPIAVQAHEVASLLGISLKQLTEAVSKGHFPAPRMLGSIALYDINEVERAYQNLPRR